MSLFWIALGRASADFFRPRVLLLTLLPLLLMLAAAWGLARLLGPWALQATAAWLNSGASAVALHWIQDWSGVDLLPLLTGAVVLVGLSLLVLAVGLILVATLTMPLVLRVVAQRHFPGLQRQGPGGLLRPLLWSTGHTALALLVFVLSLPLWLIPPLMLVLPLLIGGWLTERILAHDALLWHASVPERRSLLRSHRLSLLTMGVIGAGLSAAPALVWVSLFWFALGFVVLVPVAVWIYTAVFLWTALWFAHYLLLALQGLRQQDA